MPSNGYRLLRLFLFAAVVMGWQGCSQDRIPSSLPDTHPPSWVDSESADFHGRVAINSTKCDGPQSCRVCHGADLLGGEAGVGCVECHIASGVCIYCHGGLDNETGAPPYGLRDEIDDTTLAVGAHTAHLEGTGLGAPVACATCHLVPASILECYHLDRDVTAAGLPLDSIAEITWGGLADIGDPIWDPEARTCQGTYCHGTFAAGDSSNAPIWTGADQAACGSCHDIGSDPTSLGWRHSLHVGSFNLDCFDCHTDVVDTVNSVLTIIASPLHVNGEPDVATRDQSLCDPCHTPNALVCVDCHGGKDNQTGAPPYDLEGDSLAQHVPVGAHTPHMRGGFVADALECSDCHLVPTAVADSGHYGLDSTAEITWSSLAGSGPPVWDPAFRTCSDVYCHGEFSGGNLSNDPVWTAPGQAACGSCHEDGTGAIDDLSGKHKKHTSEGEGCRECHFTVVDAGLNIIGKSLHVDGEKTISFASGQGTFSNGDCSNISCHDDENWY